MLQQTSSTWDLQLHPDPPKFYVFFVLFVAAVAITKLAKAWSQAPPFKLSRQANNPAYTAKLTAWIASLKQWTTVTFLALGIQTSMTIYQSCNGLLNQKSGWSVTLLLLIRDYSAVVDLTLFVVLFLCFVRWHMLSRVERLCS